MSETVYGDVAYTESDLTAVRAALARGESEVQYANRRVRYRSVAELREIEKDIARRVASRHHKQMLGYAGKGFLCSSR